MASISTIGFDDKRTQSAMRGANPENFTFISGHAMRDPRRMIYIHTVARRTLPPVKRKLFPGLQLRVCDQGQRYVLSAVIPDPVPESVNNEMTGDKDIREHDGMKAAIDVLNPRNPTSHPKVPSDPFWGTNNPDFFTNRNGSNLIALGYWPSLYQVPPEEEVARAERFRDNNYRWLAREVQRLASRSTKDRDEFLQTYPDAYNALDALGIKTEYHAPPTVTATCPNCGDAIKQGVAFHKSSVTDKLCVINPEQAYKAKAITKDEYEELVTAPEPTKGKKG